MSTSFRIVKCEGAGRSFIVLYEAGAAHARNAAAVSEQLAGDTKTYLIESPPVLSSNWRTLCDGLMALLKEQGIRTASIVGFGAACALAENVYLREPKLIRTLALIDSASRPHPTAFTRIIDWLERKFPLGLPLRSGSVSFDARSHLQRIRCPVLVITTPGAGDFLRAEAHAANQAMPSSWYVSLEPADSESRLCGLIKEFQDVPARCPQKNQMRAAS